MRGIEIAHRASHLRLRSAAMPKQFAIAAGDHGARIADQRLYSVPGGGSLPFAAVERAESENDLCDLAPGCTGAMTVEGLQHPSQPRPLLAGQSGVGWNCATMQSGEQLVERFESIQPIHAEWDDRGGRCDAVMNELKMLAVAEIEQQVSGSVCDQRDRCVDLRQWLDGRQRGWCGPEHDDAGVLVR